MNESITKQALPSEEYIKLLGIALCVFNSNNAFVIENILNNKEKEILIKEPSSYLFSLIWTRKEAFGKYNNKGLIQDLSLINTLANKKSTFNTICYKGYAISIYSDFSKKVEVVKVTEEDLLESFNLR